MSYSALNIALYQLLKIAETKQVENILRKQNTYTSEKTKLYPLTNCSQQNQASKTVQKLTCVECMSPPTPHPFPPPPAPPICNT